MAYTVLDSKNIDKKKNIYTFGGSGTKPEREDIAENSKLLDYSSGEKFYYDPTKAAGSKWQPDKEPSGGGSGGSLPANFPEEDAANANKFIGFDANGDYTAKEGGSGGGQFVVTFSGVNIEAGTVDSADKTLAQIAEAVAAGKQVVGFFSSEVFGNVWMPLINAVVRDDTSFYMFSAGMNEVVFSITYGQDGGRINLELTELIKRSDVLEDTSLIVNLALDGTGETPVLRGSETYGAIKEAHFAGKHVILKGSLEDKGDFAASIIDAVYDSEANEVFITYASAGALAFTGGLTSDYVTIEVNQQGG